MPIKLTRTAYSVLAAFITIYGLIAFANHYCFRTYALDLGAYTSALYDYAHFQLHDSTSFKPYAENFLSDHFDLYLMLLSPLSWIFGSLTLLIVQIAAVIFGAIGIYKLIGLKHKDSALPAMLYFLGFFGILSAISFDYHSNVVAACFIPWLFLAVKQQQVSTFLLWVLIIVIARENLSLLLFVLLPCLLFIEKNLTSRFKVIILLSSLFCISYFLLVTTVIMPSLSETGTLHQFRYEVLGQGYGEAVKNLFTQPFKYLGLLFSNHSNDVHFDYIKAEFWIFIALSGGVLLFFNLPFLVMLLPLLAQKLYHNQPEMWGINDHYSAELAPIITIGVFYTLHKRSFLQNRFKAIQIVVLLLSIGLSVRMMDNPSSLVRKDNVRLYKASHYTSVVNHESYKKALALIPQHASLACQGLLHPHLAWRNKIYMYPYLHDADYLFLYEKQDYWPVQEKDYHQKLAELKNDAGWKLIFSENGVLVFRRR